MRDVLVVIKLRGNSFWIVTLQAPSPLPCDTWYHRWHYHRQHLQLLQISNGEIHTLIPKCNCHYLVKETHLRWCKRLRHSLICVEVKTVIVIKEIINLWSYIPLYLSLPNPRIGWWSHPLV